VVKKPKFGVGDLVTYRSDLLGVPGFNGIITDIHQDPDDEWYATIKWLDGGEFSEMFKHIVLLAKAKDDRKKKI
jgi:hypothetical protein